MKFPSPLLRGILIKRYKRFLADICLDDGTIITAHCANPGRLMGLCNPGQQVAVAALSVHQVRRLRYDWYLVQDDASFVGIHAASANYIVQEALDHKKIFAHYTAYQREVRYGQKSRIDFLLTHPHQPPFYLEVKSVTHHQQTTALFPDCMTMRGTRHLHELSIMKNQGYRAGILFVIQRSDCDNFKIAADIDPLYAQAAQQAQHKGVEFWAYTCHIDFHSITLCQPIAIEI